MFQGKRLNFALQINHCCPAKNLEKIIECSHQANCKKSKSMGLLEIYSYRFNAHGVCRRYTSIRNPLQAVKRRSCGCGNVVAACSAKRDLYILLTANSISPPFGERASRATQDPHSCAVSRLAVGYA